MHSARRGGGRGRHRRLRKPHPPATHTRAREDKPHIPYLRMRKGGGGLQWGGSGGGVGPGSVGAPSGHRPTLAHTQRPKTPTTSERGRRVRGTTTGVATEPPHTRTSRSSSKHTRAHAGARGAAKGCSGQQGREHPGGNPTCKVAVPRAAAARDAARTCPPPRPRTWTCDAQVSAWP
jgi:hypothetical protein